MKLATKDISRALKTLETDHFSVLAYGPDAGGVSDLLKRAQAAILGDTEPDPMALVKLTGEVLTADPARLFDEAAQPAFFGGPKIIHAGPVTDNHLASVQAVLEADLPAYLLLEAGTLPPKSKVRQLFEKSKNAYAAACYLDAERDIEALIDEMLIGRGVMVSRDARIYLRSQLGNDRSITRAELEKLALYAGTFTNDAPREDLSLADVRDLIGTNASETTDDIAAAAFSGLGDQADTLLKNALGQETNGVEIVRAIAWRCLRLLAASVDVDQGKSPTDAVAALKPPVFWKDKSSYTAQVASWKRMRLQACLSLIIDAEIALKGQGPRPDITLGRLLMQISMAGRRAS